MARRKAPKQTTRKQTIEPYATTFASVVVKAIVAWIAQKGFAALLALIAQWLA